MTCIGKLKYSNSIKIREHDIVLLILSVSNVQCWYSYWNVWSSIVSRLKSRNCLVPEQAGFRRNRSTCEQVAALTTHIKNGFQQQLKTGAVFLDLTAACGTVWHTGLLYKLSKNMPHWFARLIELLCELECCLSSEMVRMASYAAFGGLSPLKTVTSMFQLLNTSAARELRVHMEGRDVRKTEIRLGFGF